MVDHRLKSIPFLILVLTGVLGLPSQGTAQVVWQDLVFTGGLSAESYGGNLPAVTVTAIDSTDAASAVVGEFGLRGNVSLFNREKRTLTLRFDTGLRQFAASGFKTRDYAPKELVGRVDLSYRESAGSLGELWFYGGVSGRRVDDRPPMPLFIQPGYGTADGRVRLSLFPINGVYYDVQLFGELARYGTTDLTTQLALLDREVVGVEVGAMWGSDWTVRGYTGFKASSYPNQGTFDPSDPLRRDKTLNLGATWTLQSSLFAVVGIEGALNRSNSSRPEYNAVRLQASVTFPGPYEMGLTLSADLTAKQYRTESEYAQLVPGEEADNASVVYLEATRPFFVNLDAALRFGWTRAETDTSDDYYERFGGSLLFRYRPWH